MASCFGPAVPALILRNDLFRNNPGNDFRTPVDVFRQCVNHRFREVGKGGQPDAHITLERAVSHGRSTRSLSGYPLRKSSGNTTKSTCSLPNCERVRTICGRFHSMSPTSGFSWAISIFIFSFALNYKVYGIRKTY